MSNCENCPDQELNMATWKLMDVENREEYWVSGGVYKDVITEFKKTDRYQEGNIYPVSGVEDCPDFVEKTENTLIFWDSNGKVVHKKELQNN